MTVTKNTGAIVASGSTLDNGDGYAALEFEFAGEADVTYTAVGVHRARLQLWDYVDIFPYERFYYDNWYFTSFSGQNIYQVRGIIISAVRVTIHIDIEQKK